MTRIFTAMAAETDRLPFDIVRRGYDRAQVDQRLSELRSDLEGAREDHKENARQFAEQFSALSAENRALGAEVEIVAADRDELRARVAELSVIPTTVDGLSARLQELLQIAQDDATELRTRANANATKLLTLARAEADEIRERAQRENEEMQSQLEGYRREGERLQQESAAQQVQLHNELTERRTRVEADLAEDVEKLRSQHDAELKAYEAEKRAESDQIVDAAERSARAQLAEAASAAQDLRAKARADVNSACHEIQEARALKKQVAEQLTVLKTLLERGLPSLTADVDMSEPQVSSEQSDGPGTAEQSAEDLESATPDVGSAPAGAGPAADAATGLAADDESSHGDRNKKTAIPGGGRAPVDRGRA
jgi:chromosome segregation ATPase